MRARGWRGRTKFNLFIHHFHHGDLEMELHNHPYKWSLSFIFWGSYREERRVGYAGVISRWLFPGMVNWITANTFHRVDTKGAWTIFLTGHKTQQWGFWNRYTLRYRNHSGQ